MRKYLLAFCFSLYGLVIAPPAVAAKLLFIIDFNSGALKGQSRSGSFSVNGPLSIDFRPVNGFASFKMNIGGVSFSVADDIQFPEAPLARFNDGKLQVFDFNANADAQVLNGVDLDIFYFAGNSGVNYVMFKDANGKQSFGNLAAIAVDHGGSTGVVMQPIKPSPSKPSDQELAERARRISTSVREMFRSKVEGAGNVGTSF